jgi:hypothetical protein
LVISVVLPEPLQPARPMMRMASYSKTPGRKAGRFLKVLRPRDAEQTPQA